MKDLEYSKRRGSGVFEAPDGLCQRTMLNGLVRDYVPVSVVCTTETV